MTSSEPGDLVRSKKQFHRSVLLLLLSVIYLVSPLDIIPDITPLVGYLDDIGLILLGALNAGLRYRAMKKAAKKSGKGSDNNKKSAEKTGTR